MRVVSNPDGTQEIREARLEERDHADLFQLVAQQAWIEARLAAVP